MKKLFFIILFLTTINYSFAQNWVLYYGSGFLTGLALGEYKNSYKRHISRVLLKQQKVKFDSLPYTQIKDNTNYLALSENSKSEKIKIFKILRETPQYFILCQQASSICDCKSETYLYYKPNLKLQGIERSLSLSLKRNLIYRLNQFKTPPPKGYENMGFCEILEKM